MVGILVLAMHRRLCKMFSRAGSEFSCLKLSSLVRCCCSLVLILCGEGTVFVDLIERAVHVELRMSSRKLFETGAPQ